MDNPWCLGEYRALCEAKASIRRGGPQASLVTRAALQMLSATPEIRVEYLEVVDPATFQPVKSINGPVRIVVAAWLGSVRLIDNVLVA